MYCSIVVDQQMGAPLLAADRENVPETQGPGRRQLAGTTSSSGDCQRLDCFGNRPTGRYFSHAQIVG